MSSSIERPEVSPLNVAPKPRDDQIDAFGLTHRGLVRTENQDHFVLGSLHKTLRIVATSLPTPELLEVPSERLAFLGMVADGVGGAAAGEVASRNTLETVAQYLTNTMQCYYSADAADDQVFVEALRTAAQLSHESVLNQAKQQGVRRMATTLTLAIGVWPRLYLLHVGDSRCYRLRAGQLKQLTTDQTMAQELLARGALKPADMARSPFANVLASAIGSSADPVVTVHDIQRGDVTMLCTDGLTKHVSLERIQQRLSEISSAEEGCRALVDDALQDGGTDNVTVLIARTKVKTPAPSAA